MIVGQVIVTAATQEELLTLLKRATEQIEKGVLAGNENPTGEHGVSWGVADPEVMGLSFGP